MQGICPDRYRYGEVKRIGVFFYGTMLLTCNLSNTCSMVDYFIKKVAISSKS
jgi:hypothetical protein